MTDTDEYAISIGWVGELDKPRYEAILGAPSRSGSGGDDPFIAVAAISRPEFDAAVGAIRARGLALRHGWPSTDLDAYAAVTEVGGGVGHASLGFDQATVGHIEAIADALEPAHRAVLDDVIRQVRGLVAGG